MKRILTTHVGSLTRPEHLTKLLYAHLERPDDDGELQGAVEDAVRTSVAAQLRLGIDVVSDGEMGKPGFVNYVNERLDGFGGEAEHWTWADLDAMPALADERVAGKARARIRPVNCQGPVHYRGHAMLQRDINNLLNALGHHPPADAFMPAASPGLIASCAPNLHYSSYQAYLDAIADAMAEEYAAIVAAGLQVQLDCPDIAGAAHLNFWCKEEFDKLGPRGFAELHIAAANRALAAVDPNRVRVHLCWGNYEGPHHLDAPLEDFIEPVFGARASMISFEAANPRHQHEWEVFEKVQLPDDKVILPGVIDTLTTFVEHPRLVAQRVERFARLVGTDRVIASTDCGFASFAGTGRLREAITELKLESLVTGTRMASDDL